MNGVVVGTVTFSTPLRDSNGIDIYSKMTIEVFSHCPIAITTITFDNPQTSTYEGSQHSTDGNRDKALTDFSMYQNLGIMNFTAANSQDDKKDPCVIAKQLTTLGENPVLQKAVQDIRNTPDFYGREYSIALGKNTSGQIYAGTMNPGKENSVVLNYNIQGFFVDLHNHPSYGSHSAIDLYNITVLSRLYPDYNGGLVLAGNEVYAAVVTDLAAAQAFVSKYVIKPTPENPLSSYTESLNDEIMSVWEKMDFYLTEAQTKAKNVVLNKYNAGVTFFKQNDKGLFYPLITKETKQPNGTKKYSLIPCS